MSITFSIDNGVNYVDANCPELIDRQTEPCLCLDYSDNNTPATNCHYCKGSGEYLFEQYPFEMNLANGNAATLMNALGLEFDYCGDIEPRRLIKAITRTPAALIQRQTVSGTGDKGAKIIHCGIVEEQADSYLSRLLKIAQEAEKREEKVWWG